MKRVRTALLLLLLCAGLAPAFAEEPLTLERARSLALAQSKTLQKALAGVDAARIQERMQAYTLLPSISASASAQGAVPAASMADAAGGSVDVSVRQTVWSGTAAISAAIDSLATDGAQAQARVEYFGVLDAADAAFFAAGKASASASAAQSDLASAQASQALAKAKLDAGMITSVAYLSQEAAVASKQAALVAAQGALSVAMRSLASLTGLSLPVALAPTGTDGAVMSRVAGLADAQVDAFIAAVEAVTAQNNPGVAQARIASAAAQKAVDLAKAGYLPTVGASLSGSVGVTGGALAAKASLSLSASMSLDVWNTRAKVDAGGASAKQAALALEETRRTTSVRIQQAVYDAISSARSAAAAATALDYAERSFQSVQEQYRLSAATAADLSAAEQLLSADRAGLIGARYTFLASLSALRSLAGLESDELLVRLVP
jgi:outer membrane protein TolC